MSIEVFAFQGASVRTAGTPENPLFCADDVCSPLGYSRTRDALRMLEQDEVEMVRTECATGQKELQFVTESGLYTLIIASKRPEARKFKRWVTHEVLPSIRKTGGYGRDITKALDDPAMLRQLLLDNVEKVLALQGEVEAARPKVEVYDRIVDTGDTLGFREACKLIYEGTGGANEHEVKDFMTRSKWIQRLGGRLAPASYGQRHGYVTSRDQEVPAQGGLMVVSVLRVTQKGIARAIERMNAEGTYPYLREVRGEAT